GRAPRCDVDAAVTAKCAVELGIAGVDVEQRRVECKQLPKTRDDLDVLGPDPPEHGRAELLVPASEERALAADDADQQRHGLIAHELEQLPLAEIRAE